MLLSAVGSSLTQACFAVAIFNLASLAVACSALTSFAVACFALAIFAMTSLAVAFDLNSTMNDLNRFLAMSNQINSIFSYLEYFRIA